MGLSVCASRYSTHPSDHDSLFFRAGFGGPLLAPELTDENGRKKMVGSVMFVEVESIQEVRKIVESDLYYTKGVVRTAFPSSTMQPVSLFDLVG